MRPEVRRGDMTRLVARVLLLPTLVTAAAILVKGYAQPGDGFSAGVVASLGVLLQYMAFGEEEASRLLPLPPAGVLCFGGLLLALSIAAVPLLLGQPPLTHYPPPAEEPVHLGTLEIITAVAFDFGIFLLVFGFSVGVMRLISAAHGEEDAG
ncbi:Na(+)/H(+) antiporter subunit B [Rubrobacter xylanophilus DSM 9941]|uniref:MnhB domain-containing protein n=1 Tax=Rubrobacter xylanophilus TaxID=49319 RepID=UPI001C63F641|nr:MnhB domain-containing protein [Rubrobacter xylanophilus]QYJ16134.1 Na(+)/H(+) antiporter subunit B [Rubrobacter xylanophilus DSM 9941]